jgi:hypothetical protein
MSKLQIGPIGILPPSATVQGIFQPEKGSGNQLVEGEHKPEEEAIEHWAIQMVTRRNPTLFPGPLIVWGWNKEAEHKAALVLELAEVIPGCNIITMPDYRPIYPKIDPEAVINPCHPNLTVQHNKIEVCALVGIHCHFANITLKMIRANTNCYTTALCQYDGHEDALLSIRDLDAAKLEKLIAAVKRVLKEGTEPWALTSAGKAELEEIKAIKTREKPDEKSEATLFMADLEQGLDENAE